MKLSYEKLQNEWAATKKPKPISEWKEWFEARGWTTSEWALARTTDILAGKELVVTEPVITEPVVAEKTKKAAPLTRARRSKKDAS